MLAAKQPSESRKKETLCSAKNLANCSRSRSVQSAQRTMRDDEKVGASSEAEAEAEEEEDAIARRGGRAVYGATRLVKNLVR
jgi:hypothetical protein